MLINILATKPPEPPPSGGCPLNIGNMFEVVCRPIHWTNMCHRRMALKWRRSIYGKGFRCIAVAVVGVDKHRGGYEPDWTLSGPLNALIVLVRHPNCNGLYESHDCASNRIIILPELRVVCLFFSSRRIAARAISRPLTGYMRGCPLHDASSLTRCALNYTKSYSSEDLRLLPTLLLSVPLIWRHGHFIELGAYNGVTFSNTYMLERCCGWRGLLIEANPSNFAEVLRLKDHPDKGRRTPVMVHTGICAGEGYINVSVKGGLVAGDTSTLPEAHQRRFANLLGGSHRKHVKVPCRPLSRIMHEVNLPQAEFLSLDVGPSK
jgi:hypothetical protein